MENFRVKIRLIDGQELEVEGTRDFVTQEKERFLEMALQSKSASKTSEKYPKIDTQAWQKILETKGDLLIIKVKNPDISVSQSALMIVAGSRFFLDSDRVSALTLSKSLKRSGYLKGRLDRIIAPEIKNGHIIASGTKRNRGYQSTQKGLFKAIELISTISV
jgi:uncharacterized protein (DUF849 family)